MTSPAAFGGEIGHQFHQRDVVHTGKRAALLLQVGLHGARHIEAIDGVTKWSRRLHRSLECVLRQPYGRRGLRRHGGDVAWLIGEDGYLAHGLPRRQHDHPLERPAERHADVESPVEQNPQRVGELTLADEPFAGDQSSKTRLGEQMLTFVRRQGAEQRMRRECIRQFAERPWGRSRRVAYLQKQATIRIRVQLQLVPEHQLASMNIGGAHGHAGMALRAVGGEFRDEV
jgi:hypothetical protein